MYRRAFTLTELLVVISVIGMLASVSLGALYAARESAKREKTKATITKLDRVIQARMEDMLTRRLPMPTSPAGTVYGATMAPATRRQFANARIRVTRWLAKTEFPDRYSDVAFPHNPSVPLMDPADLITKDTVISISGLGYSPTAGQVTDTWVFSMERTATGKRIFRRAATMTTDNDAAECLYLVATSDQEDRELFNESEIGDVDGDGCNEFIDAWGTPIKWLRWPTGYVAESELMTGDPMKDHDPLDSHQLDPNAFRTVPLIWSNGPDKLSGLDLTTYDYDYATIFTNAYGAPVPPGHDEYGCHVDNITNHSIGMN